jgi:Class III cytochrome C family
MQIRKRSSKSVARRHDLNYFKKGSWLRHWQGMLTVIAIGCSLVWLIGSYTFRGPQLLSKGPISSSHAQFGEKCESCHLPVQGNFFHRAGFRKDVPDAACRQCHNIPDHQANQTFTPQCSSCHLEHTGSMMLAHTADKSCTQCHSSLMVKGGTPHFATAIHSFVNGHPEFAPLREGFEDQQAIKFAHAEHMKVRRPGSDKIVDLSCSECHRTVGEARVDVAASSVPARFEDASVSSAGPASATPVSATPAVALSRDHGRAYMAPVEYAPSCHDCHTLLFDKHVKEEAPHADTAQVRVFIAQKLHAYAVQHEDAVAAEIRNWSSETQARVPGMPVMAAPRNTDEWITIRTAQAERRIWGESCALCHVMQVPDLAPNATVHDLAAMLADPTALPAITPTRQPTRFLTHAVFSHGAHQSVSCIECHSKTSFSQSAKDVLLPSIKSCQSCHDGQSRPQGPVLSAGHAESGCFLCHEYHGWEKLGILLPHAQPSSASEIGLLMPPK